jgi:protein gp37
MVFVNSMSDLFHREVPLSFIQWVFETIETAPQHTFQVLTKRAGRLASVASQLNWPSNLWMGVSVETQDYLWRVERLQTVPATVRFVSFEPLLNSIESVPLEGIHWVIVGGESGPRARPMRVEWARTLRDECIAAGVPFFFKQWGGVQRKKAGRLLDKRTWDEFPHLAASAS